MEVVRQHPQLLERLIARMARVTEQLTAAGQHATGAARQVDGRPAGVGRGRGNPADDLRRRH